MPFDGFETDYLTIPADDVEAARILREAADKVRRGWWQHKGVDEPNGACASNAIGCNNLDAQVIFAEFMFGTTNIGEIFAWNDAPGRTKEEVISALEDCSAWLLVGRPGP